MFAKSIINILSCDTPDQNPTAPRATTRIPLRSIQSTDRTPPKPRSKPTRPTASPTRDTRAPVRHREPRGTEQRGPKSEARNGGRPRTSARRWRWRGQPRRDRCRRRPLPCRPTLDLRLPIGLATGAVSSPAAEAERCWAADDKEGRGRRSRAMAGRRRGGGKVE